MTWSLTVYKWSRLENSMKPPGFLGFGGFFCFLFCFCFAVLGLRCCAWVFSSCSEQGLLSSCGAWGSHCSGSSCCRPRALERTGIAVARGFSRSAAGGILPDQWQGACSLQWRQILIHCTTREVPPGFLNDLKLGDGEMSRWTVRIC